MEMNVSWQGEMAFQGTDGNNSVIMDALSKGGGEGKGLTPKQLLLTSLAGCTAMDVISILSKMKVVPEYFNIKIESQTNNEHPIYFKQIKLIYQFRGEGLPVEKLKKAVSLSQEKYCGISYMLGKAAELSFEVELLD